MIKVQTIFCWIITCIICVYINVYAFSKVSSFAESQYYQSMQKKYDDINQRLSKETILKVNSDPDSIQNLFNVITSNDRLNNPNFKENFNALIKKKTEEFLTILKTKKIMYTIQQSPSISDYLNKEGSQSPKLKELNNYLNEHIALNKNRIGSYSKQKMAEEITILLLLTLMASVLMLILLFQLISINSIYTSLVILSTNSVLVGIILFFRYQQGYAQ